MSINNFGNRDAQPNAGELYLSDDYGDTLLKRFSIPKIKTHSSKTVRFRSSLPSGENGSGKYIVFVADADDMLLELDETNNMFVFGPLPCPRAGSVAVFHPLYLRDSGETSSFDFLRVHVEAITAFRLWSRGGVSFADSRKHLIPTNFLTLKGLWISLLNGSGQVLVGLLDFKSSGGQTMSVVGSIPMHFRQSGQSIFQGGKDVWNRHAGAARHLGHRARHFWRQ